MPMRFPKSSHGRFVKMMNTPNITRHTQGCMEVKLHLSQAVVDVFVITPIFFPYGLDAEPVPMERLGIWWEVVVTGEVLTMDIAS